MVRSELLQKMCNLHPDILARDMEKIFEIIFIEFTNAFCRNENIEIRGFGTFRTKINKARRARNPKTGESINVDEKKSVHFKMGKILVQKVNSKGN